MRNPKHLNERERARRLWFRAKYSLRDWLREKWEKSIGMRLALWLDKRHPDWCWAGLCVNVGLGYDLRNWRDGVVGTGCKSECTTSKLRGCYCGKFIHESLQAELRSKWMERPPPSSRAGGRAVVIILLIGRWKLVCQWIQWLRRVYTTCTLGRRISLVKRETKTGRFFAEGEIGAK